MSKKRSIPFRAGEPIKDPLDFVGRGEILRTVSRAMLDLANVSIQGERRIGKTSLLFYLAHADTAQVLGLPANHVPVYFDFQSFAQAEVATLGQALARTISKTIVDRRPDKRVESEHFEEIVSRDFTTTDEPGLFGTTFSDAFVSLEDSDLIFHLLFDEFERTADNPHLGETFYDALRGLISLTENVSYVIATRTGLSALQPHQNKFSSPLSNIFISQTLMPFQESDAYDLIFEYFLRAGVNRALAEELWTESLSLYELTGYHPFLLQTLCYHLYARLNEPDWPRGQAWREALKAFEEDTQPHFRYYWDVSSKPEKTVIRELAIRRPADWIAPELPGAIERLRERGLVVVAKARGYRWQLVSSSFSEWVKSNILVHDSASPLADFVIITALKEERDAVLSKLPAYQRLRPTEDDVRVYFSADLPVTFPDGLVDSYRIVVMPLLGMGRIEAAAAAQDAIRRWGPRYIILIGVAGGIAEHGIELGDVIVSDQILDYGLQKLTPFEPEIRWEAHRADPRLVGAARNFGNEGWNELVEAARPGPGKPRCHIGPIISGDKAIAFSETLARYRDVWPRLIGVEMEAVGVTTAAFQAVKPPGLFVVRGVASLADESKVTDKAEEWQRYACDVAASYTIALLKNGPVLPEVQESAKGTETLRPNALIRPNPFIYGRPVQPDEFLNREPELRAIFNRLRNGESTAISGEPHIGKTSLLLKLFDPTTQQAYLGDEAQRLTTSLLDLHPIGPDYTSASFWEEALESLDRNASDGELKRAAEDNYSRRSIQRIFNYLGKRERRLVLLLDEFERLLNHPNFQTPAFFALLRSLATRTGGLALVTASRHSVAEMNERGRNLLTAGSPFFNHMIDMRLTPFDEGTINKLLDQAGDAFFPNDRRFIRRVAGPNPFLLQAMAAVLMETTDHDRHVHAAELFYEQSVSHFDDLWHVLDDRVRTAAVVLSLMELARYVLGQEFVYEELERVDAFGQELRKLAEQGLTKHLREKGQVDWKCVIRRQGEWWRIETQALTWWVRDVVLVKSRRVMAYDEWLANKGYRHLLTQEQWERLVDTVRDAADWNAYGVSMLARELFRELGGKEGQ